MLYLSTQRCKNVAYKFILMYLESKVKTARIIKLLMKKNLKDAWKNCIKSSQFFLQLIVSFIVVSIHPQRSLFIGFQCTCYKNICVRVCVCSFIFLSRILESTKCDKAV